MIIQGPPANSFSILNDVFSFEFVLPVIFVFSRSSIISYVTSFEIDLLFSLNLISNVASSPGL